MEAAFNWVLFFGFFFYGHDGEMGWANDSGLE